MTSTTIEARFRVVTPLFGDGADPRVAELRLPSFKGVLRFWWRALAWSRCGGDLGRIREEEDRIFGSSKTGQSRLRMRLVPMQAKPRDLKAGEVLTVTSGAVIGHGARYFGYGVMEAFGRRATNDRPATQAGQLTRDCLLAPFEFTVLMRTRDIEPGDLASIEKALIALGTIGGMGAKSRKGYGSLVLLELRVDGKYELVPATSIRELRDRVAALHGAAHRAELPEFTALSNATRLALVSAGTVEPLELLDRVGREQVRYRSWGRDGNVLGGNADSEMRFRDDHDLMEQLPGSRTEHPLRVAFGLPHNYKPRASQPGGHLVGPAAKGLDRRASPLFVHVHMCGTTPVAVVSLLPARFLPRGESTISVGGAKVLQMAEDVLFQPLHGFLDRLLGQTSGDDRRRESFTEAMEVRS